MTRWQTDDPQPSEDTSDLPLFIADRPLPYAKDSDTSKEAADRMHVKAANDRRRVLACYRAFGPMTSDECAEKLEESVLSIRPRTTELRQNGFLERTGERRVNASGMRAWVLRSVK